MSSMASFSSLIAAAMLLSPTGPPPNLSMMACNSRRSASSKPLVSTSSIFSASRATSRVIRPSARTWAKSRTRRSSRLATRGVPRERLAISTDAASSIGTSKMPAERRTISCRSTSR